MSNKKPKHYTDEFIKMAMMTLDENGGNLSATAKNLNVDKSTLMRWRDNHNVFKASLTKLVDADYFETEVVEPYVIAKSKNVIRALEIRDKGLDIIEMYYKQLNEDNILTQDLKKIADTVKITHEIGTGVNLDDKEQSKGNNFWTVINNKILNQRSDEESN